LLKQKKFKTANIGKLMRTLEPLFGTKNIYFSQKKTINREFMFIKICVKQELLKIGLMEIALAFKYGINLF
jgi:hypothetical protein